MADKICTDLAEWRKQAQDATTEVIDHETQEHQNTREVIRHESERFTEVVGEHGRVLMRTNQQLIDTTQNIGEVMQDIKAMMAQLVQNVDAVQALQPHMLGQLNTLLLSQQTSRISDISEDTAPATVVGPDVSATTAAVRAQNTFRAPIFAEPGSQNDSSYVIRCCCSCHSIFPFQTPRILYPIIGQLCVLLKGNPFKQCICALRRCKNSGRGPGVRMVYNTPSSLPSAFSIHYSDGVYGNPERPWTMHNTLPYYSEVFNLVMYGDIESLKEMFESREARPTDRNPDGDSLPLVSSTRTLRLRSE